MSTNRFVTILNGIRTLVTAISASAGAPDANKIVATGSNGLLDVSLMPAGMGQETITATASEALAAGDYVNLHDVTGTRSARKADASNGRAANGFVAAAVTSGQTATVFLVGRNTNVTGRTPGQTVFLSATTPGTGTATAPTLSAGGISQVLGVAVATTADLFEFDAPITIA